MDYKATLNLPKTNFPMRANAAVREPEIQEMWRRESVFERLLALRDGRPRFVLHDGPPYSSSGQIHIGHAMNKILKDIVVKHKALTGFQTPFIVGYDCHGLPTEIAALKELKGKKDLTALEVRSLSRQFALKSIEGQHAAFKRLGVFADWDHPYMTMDPRFEAVQIRVFGQMAAKGYIYKGLKPVYWCSACVTALAEAEVEYEDHVSPSIYVAFPLVKSPALEARLAGGRDVRLAIWTTTPWTLPANLAIAVHPDFDYAVLETAGRDLVVAAERIDAFREATGIACTDTGLRVKGSDLVGSTYRHVFADRESPVIPGQHVTLETGSGLVHTAPGHGHDDYLVGKAHGLPVLAPIDDRGRMTVEAGDWLAGTFYADANAKIVSRLEQDGALLANDTVSHSYPHCWRCHKPVIFRATDQWFASVAGFRDQALAEIGKVSWHPANGEVRIRNMVAERSDWCISRQRSWGVPIPVFYCEACDAILITPETTESVARHFEAEGSDAWWIHPASDLLPPGTACQACGHGEFRKESDIMDVWFDSGTTHESVCAARGLGWPVDLYLEGSDQYRGWFQSSLLTAVATRGQAPYRMVITHGFALDEQRRKMSKSLGNVVDPLEVIKTLGADVLRLWVSSQDYTSDVSISNQMLSQLAEVYRKIRNTARFLLGNLYDFDPARDEVDYAELPEIDRFALHRLQEVIRDVREDFETFHYDPFFHLVQNYCVGDLSGFYLDVTKDRLYASAPGSRPRRAAQTVLHHMLQALMRLISPVLSHLAEDIHSFLPAGQKGGEASVFFLDFPEVRVPWLDEALSERWKAILAVRADVNKLLEEARQRKEVGSSADAIVRGLPDLNLSPDELREALNVSQVEVGAGGPSVGPAPGTKCPRCWLILPEVDPEGGLCGRCQDVVGMLEAAGA